MAVVQPTSAAQPSEYLDEHGLFERFLIPAAHGAGWRVRRRAAFCTIRKAPHRLSGWRRSQTWLRERTFASRADELSQQNSASTKPSGSGNPKKHSGNPIAVAPTAVERNMTSDDFLAEYCRRGWSVLPIPNGEKGD